MKKIKLLTISLLFLSLLVGCGMKGPLYRAPATANADVKKEMPSQQEKLKTISAQATESE
ncbi:LPS translocon maturation chaperone LptM [Psychromonas antarctica]|jgi:predicted small lipoprotein YifL|uniref:LPS translocon maturation chaperone LptM n=1 Tax=Psychromonas antarctica TaxID=67573 RepID=UPI0030844EAB